MIINGIVFPDWRDEWDEKVTDAIEELIEDEGIGNGEDVINEALATMDNKLLKGYIDGGDKDFTIKFERKEDSTDSCEYRFIHENDVDDIYRDEAYDYYDEYEWKEAVSNDATEEGLEDWRESMLDEGDYASFFSTYDGSENQIGDFMVYRVS